MWAFSVLVPVEVSNYQPLDDNKETNTSKARMGGIFRTFEYALRILDMYGVRRIARTRPGWWRRGRLDLRLTYFTARM